MYIRLLINIDRDTPTAWGARGRKFKSSRPDTDNQSLTMLLVGG